MTTLRVQANPSAWPHRAAVIGFAVAGLAISIYLTLFQTGVIDHVWDPVFGGQSRRVLDSVVTRFFERWFGVPDSLIGSLAYFAEGLIASLATEKRWYRHPWLVVVYGLTVVGMAIFSLFLVCMQAFVIDAWCFLCLVSAAIAQVQVYLAHREVLAAVWALLDSNHSSERADA